MKGSFQGLSSVKLPFIVITLLCAACLFWWENVPFSDTFSSAENVLLRVSPDIFLGSPLISTTPERNVPVDSESHGFLRNGSSDKYKGLEVGDQNHNFTTQDSTETGDDEGISVASPDLSLPSQSQILSDNTSFPFSKNDTLDWHQQPEVDVAVHNVSLIDSVRESNQACNLAKGKWVKSDTRPLYSGFGCKQWLSSMWACRMTQRTDFSYEKFRWQPQDCELEEFEGATFLRRMQDKTLAFIGDSLGRQQFQSLMCMITGGKYRTDVKDVGKEFGLVKARRAIRPDGWAYSFPVTNTTILFYWSASLCDLQPINLSDPSTHYAMHLDRPPAFLRKYFHRFNVLVLNTGHHWNRGKLSANKWVMYVNGQPNTDRRLDIGRAKNITVHSIIRWVDAQLPHHPNMKAFFRSISPRHFFNGDWNTGGTCDNTNPLSKSLEVLKDNPSDELSSTAVKGTKVKLLDITGPSELRDEGHMSRYSVKGTPGAQDCLHWCLPGVPDTWNEMLFAQL